MRTAVLGCLAVLAMGEAIASAQVPTIFLTTTPLSAAPEEQRQAIQYFRDACRDPAGSAASREKFDKAARCYSKMIGDGCHLADVFVNCGNAYLLADDLPRAILAYRQGLGRYPLDRQLWENLEFARDQVAYPSAGGHNRPPGDEWPPFLPRPAPDTLLYLGLALHTLGWVAATAWLMTRDRKLATLRLTLWATALLVGIWWVYVQVRLVEDRRQAVVVVTVNGVTLRRGNGSLYPRHPDLPRVNRGMEGRLLGTRGHWVQVQFPGGEIGWLPEEVVVIDLPTQGIIDGGAALELMNGTTNR